MEQTTATEKVPAPEAMISAQERLLRQLVQYTPAAVAMFDREMRYLLYSRRWVEDYGLGERDLTGLSHYEVFPEIPERWKELHRRALAGEVLRCEEEAFPRADGRIDWVRWELRPWHEPDGGIGGIIIYTEVITAQVEAREALRRQAAELEQANAEACRAQKRFERLFQSEVVGLIRTNFQGAILDANDAFLHLVGYSRADLEAGRLHWPALTPPEYLDKSWKRMEEVRRTGVAGPWEKEYLRKEGGRATVMLGSVLLEPGGDELMSVVMDITPRKQAEDALRYMARASQVLASSLDLETTLNNLACLGVPMLGDWCMIYVTDDGPSLYRAALAYADPADAALARRLEEFPAPSLECLGPVLEHLRAGKPKLFDQVPDWLLNSLGTSPEHDEAIRALHPTSAVTVPILGRGELVGLANFFATTPGRHYSETELVLADELGRCAGQAVGNARLYAEAQRANAVKDQFIAMISHELRNPLAPVLTGVQLIRRRFPDDPQLRRVVDLVERNVKLQARLISDLLDASHIVRGGLEVHRAPMLLDPVVDAAVQAQAASMEQAGLTLTTHLQPGIRVLGDADRLQQVVMNLLSNAIKFTQPGGKVRVSLSKGEGVACLVVEDTGIGIEAELLPRLFGMFQQGKVAGERAAGLGIGLSIVQHVVRAHEGRVRAESEGPGKGSRFTVELPLLPAA